MAAMAAASLAARPKLALSWSESVADGGYARLGARRHAAKAHNARPRLSHMPNVSASASSGERAPQLGRREALTAAMASALALSVSGSAVSAAPIEYKAVRGGNVATVTLTATKGNNVTGTVTFTEVVTKYSKPLVEVSVDVAGLSPGPHGFHIHAIGGVTCDDGTCTGGHYNPDGLPHGGPTTVKKFGASASHFVGEGVSWWRHAGDLGNIVADSNGVAKITFTDPVIKLTGDKSIVGRAIVIHGGEDDLTSQPAGNAGPRVAYGTIV